MLSIGLSQAAGTISGNVKDVNKGEGLAFATLIGYFNYRRFCYSTKNYT